MTDKGKIELTKRELKVILVNLSGSQSLTPVQMNWILGVVEGYLKRLLDTLEGK